MARGLVIGRDTLKKKKERKKKSIERCKAVFPSSENVHFAILDRGFWIRRCTLITRPGKRTNEKRGCCSLRNSHVVFPLHRLGCCGRVSIHYFLTWPTFIHPFIAPRIFRLPRAVCRVELPWLFLISLRMAVSRRFLFIFLFLSFFFLFLNDETNEKTRK